jgi:hypothetical protein
MAIALSSANRKVYCRLYERVSECMPACMSVVCVCIWGFA